MSKEAMELLLNGIAEAAQEGRIIGAGVYIPRVEIEQADGSIKIYPASEAIYTVKVRRGNPYKVDDNILLPSPVVGLPSYDVVHSDPVDDD